MPTVSHMWKVHEDPKNARKSNDGLPGVFKKDGPKAWVCVVSLYSLLLTGRTDTPCTTSADVVHEAVATRPD